ncbi:hypothetical protein [Candidatus Bealeia paramacronuclearis]|uniref:hypothetical protein n=1 Tax=Candidatus Bealeia paramacronuclearis TaxID=1921001 RepID=UPI002F268CCA
MNKLLLSIFLIFLLTIVPANAIKTFDDLPEDTNLEIAGKLVETGSYNSLLNWSRTSKKWNKLVKNEKLWKETLSKNQLKLAASLKKNPALFCRENLEDPILFVIDNQTGIEEFDINLSFSYGGYEKAIQSYYDKNIYLGTTFSNQFERNVVFSKKGNLVILRQSEFQLLTSWSRSFSHIPVNFSVQRIDKPQFQFQGWDEYNTDPSRFVRDGVEIKNDDSMLSYSKLTLKVYGWGPRLYTLRDKWDHIKDLFLQASGKSIPFLKYAKENVKKDMPKEWIKEDLKQWRVTPNVIHALFSLEAETDWLKK